MQAVEQVPRFFLYGDEHGDVELSFLHVERVHQRSSVHDWTIRPHAHPDHHQVLFLTRGRGSALIEDGYASLTAPALVVVPSLTVHAYAFEPQSDGWVLTIAAAFLDAASEGDRALASSFEGTGFCLDSAPVAGPDLHAAFATVEREFVWQAPARRVAVKANLQMILVAIARARDIGEAVPAIKRRNVEIVQRYRTLVEREFRSHLGLPAFAASLGVTTARLNAACRAVTGRSALAVVHDRLVIEAKRALIYTSMTAADVAMSLGFTDAAYFSRFFVKRTGVTPWRFKTVHGAAAPEPTLPPP